MDGISICVISPKSVGHPAIVTALVLVYGFYTMLLNVGITGAIIAKILQYRRFLRQALGEKHGIHYISIISILVESASIIVAYDLFFLIPAVIGHPLANIGRQVGTMIQVRSTYTPSPLVLFLTDPCSAYPSSYDYSKSCSRDCVVHCHTS